jgi:hypothetical protein
MTVDKFDPREHCCADCLYFVHGNEEADSGFCYRYPPRVEVVAKKETPLFPHKGSPTNQPSFRRITSVPQVFSGQFCGEGVLK